MPHSPVPFDKFDIFKIKFNGPRVEDIAEGFANNTYKDTICELNWLIEAVRCCDLTTLSGDDSISNVSRLCGKALKPISPKILMTIKDKFNVDLTDLKVAAVCVYPVQIKEVRRCLGDSGVKIAAVCTGFPSGQYGLEGKLSEVKYCVSEGADEIDIVLSRHLVLQGRWKEVYEEVRQVTESVPRDRVKVKCILETGQLGGSYTTVYRAAMVSLLAGADTVKTSTGKESPRNATVSVIMVMAIATIHFEQLTGIKVGLKPAGGMRKAEDALRIMSVVRQTIGELGGPKLFRLGCSSLLGALEKRMMELAVGDTRWEQEGYVIAN